MALPSTGPIDLQSIYSEYYKSLLPSHINNAGILRAAENYQLGTSPPIELTDFYSMNIITPYISDWRDPSKAKNTSGYLASMGSLGSAYDCSIHVRPYDLPETYSYDVSVYWSAYSSNSSTIGNLVTDILYRRSTNGGVTWGSPTSLVSVVASPGNINSNSSVTAFTMGTNEVIQFMPRVYWTASLPSGSSHFAEADVHLIGGKSLTSPSLNKVVTGSNESTYFDWYLNYQVYSYPYTGYAGSWEIVLV